jgi:predicted outer membrane repeat protein
MKIKKLLLILSSLLFFLTLTLTKVEAQLGTSGLVFVVNDTGDSLDANPGDSVCKDSSGKCTFRAAVMEANAGLESDIISFALPSPAVINLTLGKISITANVSIVGPGSRRLTIQRSAASGTANFRIFELPNTNTKAAIRGLKISNGSGVLQGGGVYIQRGATANLTDVVLSNNQATTGGAIANVGTLNLTRSLLNSNTADSQGGAIMNVDGLAVARITNTTITDNATVTGGAIYNSGSLLLVNNTIFHNSATNLGSSVVNTPGGAINILNTIIAGDSTLPVTALQGAFISLGNNLISDARTSTGFTNGVNNDRVSNNNSIDPLIGNLVNNGGQTDTRIPLAGSPAIDGGNSCVRTATCPVSTTPPLLLTSDQRTNFARNVGEAVDIGAVETGAAAASGTIPYTGVFGGVKMYGGTVMVLTDTASGNKAYQVVRPGGFYQFEGLVIGEVYILETRIKRSGNFLPLIIVLDNF